MFCDRCGAEIQSGQRYCSSCGKAAGVAVVPAPPGGRVARHIQLLAIFWMAASAMNLIGAAALFFLGNLIFGRIIQIQDAWPLQGFLQGLFSTLGVLVLVKAILGFAAGWGLLQREPWARVLALVLAFVSLLNVPLGTALGIYTIWVLLSKEGDEEYRQIARAA